MMLIWLAGQFLSSDWSFLLGKSEAIAALVGIIVIIGQAAINFSTIKKTAQEIESLKNLFLAHSADTSHHLDPVRDEARWANLERSHREIQSKLDTILIEERKR